MAYLIRDLEILHDSGKKQTLFFVPTNTIYLSPCNDYFVALLDIFVSNHYAKNITNIIGSSAHAISALLLCLGYTVEEIPIAINHLPSNTDNLLMWLQSQLTERLGHPLATFMDLGVAP